MLSWGMHKCRSVGGDFCIVQSKPRASSTGGKQINFHCEQLITVATLPAPTRPSSVNPKLFHFTIPAQRPTPDVARETARVDAAQGLLALEIA